MSGQPPPSSPPGTWRLWIAYMAFMAVLMAVLFTVEYLWGLP